MSEAKTKVAEMLGEMEKMKAALAPLNEFLQKVAELERLMNDVNQKSQAFKQLPEMLTKLQAELNSIKGVFG